jgi:hypothetical protein
LLVRGVAATALSGSGIVIVSESGSRDVSVRDDGEAFASSSSNGGMAKLSRNDVVAGGEGRNSGSKEMRRPFFSGSEMLSRNVRMSALKLRKCAARIYPRADVECGASFRRTTTSAIAAPPATFIITADIPQPHPPTSTPEPHLPVPLSQHTACLAPVSATASEPLL